MSPSAVPISEAVVRAARDCLGTPFVHQGRIPGVGLDCVGLLAHAFGVAGLPGIDANVPYGYPPPPELLERHLAKYLQRVMHGGPQPADVVVIQIGNRRCHAGLWTESGTVVHVETCGAIEARPSRPWSERRRSLWRWQQQP